MAGVPCNRSKCLFWVVNTHKSDEKHGQTHPVSRQIHCPKGADDSNSLQPITDSRAPFGVVFVCTGVVQTKYERDTRPCHRVRFIFCMNSKGMVGAAVHEWGQVAKLIA